MIGKPLKGMGPVEYYTTTTHVLRNVDGIITAVPVTPLMKVGGLLVKGAAIAAIGQLGKLASELNRQ